MATSRKTVLITGCSAGGIGGGLAEGFLEKGYHVFAGLRTPSKASEILSNSKNVKILTLDVLSSESIAAAVESVKKDTGGKLDVLVNNSGAGVLAPALDISIEEGRKLFDLNYWAPVAMVQAFAPLLIKAKGCIVNNTSANSVVPMPLMSKFPTASSSQL
jgi:1-acylglycerone phosphate reductase